MWRPQWLQVTNGPRTPFWRIPSVMGRMGGSFLAMPGAKNRQGIQSGEIQFRHGNQFHYVGLVVLGPGNGGVLAADPGDVM
jgi:hypothetical protein